MHAYGHLKKKKKCLQMSIHFVHAEESQPRVHRYCLIVVFVSVEQPGAADALAEKHRHLLEFLYCICYRSVSVL